ncbi:MAG: choice-of-anchor J domain-containing protein [Prevotella sp.]|nr:choice-of-anchor J domain-containing protein [Prevotella sp.]
MSHPVNVGYDGLDVYVKGISTFLPDAWIQGTLDLSSMTVTFPYGQYFGQYAGYYDMYLNSLVEEDVVFSFDAAKLTMTLKNEFFLVDNPDYYFDWYASAVIKPVLEKATMPANPQITALQESMYGWYINFNVPVVDVDNNGLLASGLSYIIYTDVEGVITPLTFTPETHIKLTENLTEIPYGFTENYDFYDTQIYLNDLFSSDWNNIGIQSVYTCGGETNATEIQWFHIKNYAKGIVWVAAEQGYENEEDVESININFEVTGTLSAGTNESNSPKYYTSGSALRMYAGNTLTITSSGEPIKKIVFTFTGSANQMNLESDLETYVFADKVGTWTGSSNTVTFTVPSGQARIQKIEVFYNASVDPNAVYDFEDSTLGDWTTIDGDGDGYTWTLASELMSEGLGHNGSVDCALSQSYANSVGALTPENYLVSPQRTLGGCITFWACAQDAKYAAEHFGVFVSTKGNTDKADFEKIDEWTMTASRTNAPANSRGAFRSPNKTQGTWYQYVVDLSKYEGQEGYVAICHFDCTDMFYLLVDDIQFGAAPDYIITPAEGEVDALNLFSIKFYNYDIEAAEGAKATLLNTTNGDSQTAAIKVEGNAAVITFDDTTVNGEYTLTIPAGALKNVTDNEDVPELQFFYFIDGIVELPEGVEPMEYTLTAAGATSQGDLDIEDTKFVAFDGNDVYLQGLAYYFPDAYVKGTLNANNQIVIPSGQFVGVDEYGKEYLVALDVDDEGYIIDAENIVFNFDAESGVISLVENTFYGESGVKDATGLYDYFYEATYTPGAIELPDPVVAPEELEPFTAYLSCNSYNGKIRARELQVGYKGTDAYIQGLCEYIPEAWVKGTIDLASMTVTFPTGQFYGTFADTYNLFFVGYDYDADEIADVVFDLNVEDQSLTTDQWIILNGKQNKISYYDYYYDVVITKEKPEVPEVVEAPEDLVTEAYQFKGFDTYFEEDVTKEVQAGFYGEGQVYIQGLSDYVPEAWVVGTLEGTTLTIPETYLGIFTFWGTDYEVFFSGATFTYDAEAGTFTSADGFVTYEDPSDEEYMDEYVDVVLTKLNDVAATPVDPEITNLVTTGGYPKVNFNILLEDTEGNPIIGAKTSYQIFFEKGGVEQALTLDADLYEKLDEDLTEIPYGFSDGWDIFTSTVYLNQGVDELATWSKVGIQTIYRGGGEVNKSNIVWMENPDYDPTVVGINDINANNNAVYYDMQGRVADASAKGLLIKQTRNANGTVKTVKVVRK